MPMMDCSERPRSLTLFAAITLPLLFMIAQTLFLYPFEDSLWGTEWMYLLALPLLEEFFKYMVAITIRQFVLLSVVLFGVYELLFVKFSEFYISYSGDWYLLIFAVIALNFHVSTAIVYRSTIFIRFQKLTLLTMIISHSFFNFLGGMEMPFLQSFILLLTASLFPLAYLYLHRKFRQIMGYNS